MSGAAGLLRLLGVARAVLSLGGRYRVARAVSVVVAVGWLLVTCAGGAHAIERPGYGADDPRGRIVHDHGARQSYGLVRAVAKFAGYPVYVAVCAGAVAISGVVWRRVAVSDGAGSAFADSRPAPGWAVGDVPDRADGDELGPVTKK